MIRGLSWKHLNKIMRKRGTPIRTPFQLNIQHITVIHHISKKESYKIEKTPLVTS